MKKITTLALGLMLASTAFAQKANSAAQIPTFQETMGKYFLVGAAINTDLPDGQDPAGEEVVKKQFNQVVAENCMKGEENQDISASSECYMCATLTSLPRRGNISDSSRCSFSSLS